jgi:guanylate kinase
MEKEGKVVIFSAPSGSGKTTIVQRLLKERTDLGFSISATTRRPRGTKEQPGVDYYFYSAEEFKNAIDNKGLIEWEEVYAGVHYGTLKSEIQRLWDLGKTVVFDVDVIGGISLKKYFGEKALSIFVRAPSIEVVEQRLRSRGTEDDTSLKIRLNKIEEEWSYQDDFDYQLINDELDRAVSNAHSQLDKFIQI